MAKIKQGEINEAIKEFSEQAGGNPYTPPRNYPGTSIINTSGTLNGRVDSNPTLVSGDEVRTIKDGQVVNTTKTELLNDPTRRIGDYVWVLDEPQVVPNSITDYAQRYAAVTGGTERQTINIGDIGNALLSGIVTGKGIPDFEVDSPEGIAKTAGTWIAYQGIKGVPGAGQIAGLMSFATSLEEAQQAYNDIWYNTEVDYESAIDFERDENGKLLGKINYDKMKNAGLGSGRGIFEASDTSGTGVQLLDDNKLDISVSDDYANTDDYASVLKNIKEMLPTLTKDQADAIVDEDTGMTLLDSINNYVKSAESQYYYSSRSIKVLKDVAPAASAEALAKGSYTMLAGYVDSDNLKDMTITTYDSENKEQEVNAYDYFNDFKKLDKTKRNDYIESISNRIQSNVISDDEKAVLQAQANALYAASDNDGEFKGMLQKDFFDHVGDMSDPIFGVRLGTLGDWLGGYGSLTAFKDDETLKAFMDLGSGALRIHNITKIMNGIEKIFRSGSGKLPGKVGRFFTNLSENAPQDEKISMLDVKSLGELKNYAVNTVAQTGYQMSADTAYDLASWAAHAAAGEDYDFWEELRKDFLLDVLVTYGPKFYKEAMERPRYEYRPVEVRYYESDADEFFTGDGKGRLITDIEYKPVEVTAKELSMRRAAIIDKLTDNKIALKVQQLFFDKNAAMSKLSVQVLAKTGDNYLFRKVLRHAGDIRQLTEYYQEKFKQYDDYTKAMSNLGQALRDYAPKGKYWTDADKKYLNAVQNQARFIQDAEGDQATIRKVKAFYKDAIQGVSKERAAQLNEIGKALANAASAIRDMYERYGLLKTSELEKLQKYDGYFPVYTKANRLLGGEIMQTRAGNKSIFDPNTLISLDEMEDPLVSLAQYANNTARNIALNEKAKAIREGASVGGTGIHIYKDSGGALKDVENLKDLNQKFSKEYEALKRKIEKEYPTQEEWQAENDKIVLKSKAIDHAKDLQTLKDENVELSKKLRNLQKEYRKTTVTEKEMFAVYGKGAKADDVTKATLEKRIKSNQQVWSEIQETKFEIAANRQQQTLLLNDIRDDIVKDMEKAAKLSKNPMALDIKSYTDVQLTNMLKRAFKANNAGGQIQAVINKAVESAKPYVDRNLVLQTRAEEAAAKFRKRVNKEIKIKGVTNKTALDSFNHITNKATDYIVSRVLGKRGNKVRVLDSDDLNKIYTTHGAKNEIHYRLDGEDYTMTLTGEGAEQLVEEFYAPEFRSPKTIGGKIWQKIYGIGNKTAQAKRYLTTAMDPSRVMPNLARDWSRGIVSTGGLILLSPDTLRTEVLENGNYSEEEIKKIDGGWQLVYDNIAGSTLTKSMETPRKNRSKSMRKALMSPDGGGFVRFIAGTAEKIAPGGYGKQLGESIRDAKTVGEGLSVLQDAGETYTRTRAMTNAYYETLGLASSRGIDINKAIERATEAAYFAGEEATNNFFRRGTLISKFAQQVPYLTQRFATLESFKYAWIDNPIAVTRSLHTTVMTYAAMIALVLSNEQSRKNYYMLSEYDRANNIIMSLDNETIITIPLDDTIAAFLTPYRRAIETLNGVDPEAFYLWGKDFLEALSPIDLTGFSEGDKFNVVRGFEKLGAEFIPTWAQPIIEALTGRDLYYGSNISVDADYVGATTGVYDPTPGQMTTKSKNSKTLASVSDNTGIPQWILQNIVSEYGGNVGQYALNAIDRLSGATEDEQGGKEFRDAIFKPFTGMDSANATNAFYTGINDLKEEKATLQAHLKTIGKQLETAVGNDRVNILDRRQKLIDDYGTKVSDFLDEYLSAFEITGGLSKSQANQVWYLYKLYDDDEDSKMVLPNSTADYYSDKARVAKNKYATALAAKSGIDQYVNQEITYNPAYESYNKTYGQQAFENSVYGDNMNQVAKVNSALKDANITTSVYYDKIAPLVEKYYAEKNYDAVNDLYAKWNAKVMQVLLPVLDAYDGDVETLLKSNDMTMFLRQYIKVPNTDEAMGRGKYYSSKTGLNKQDGYIRSYVLKLYKKMKGIK